MFYIYYLICCLAIGFLGRHRRIGALGFFLASVLLTPIISLLILVLSTHKRAETN